MPSLYAAASAFRSKPGTWKLSRTVENIVDLLEESAGAVDRSGRGSLGQQLPYSRTNLGRIPAPTLVHLGSVLPTVRDRQLAAFDLENATCHEFRTIAAEPDHQRGDVGGVHRVEAGLRLVHEVEDAFGHPGTGRRGDGVHR